MAIYGKRKNYGAIIGGVIIIILVLIALAGTAYFFLTKETIDAETLCPNTGPKGQYVVLIDNTSPFPFIQKSALSQRLKNLVRNDLPEGYMLSVFLLGEDATKNDRPLFERCSPGQWGAKSELTNNRKLIERNFRDKFTRPLEDVVRKISLQEHAKNSPIFEMLQLVGINGFERVNVSGEKKLIIYSDMLANTSEFSMYRSQIPAFDNFIKTPYAQRALSPALQDVSVELNVIAGDQKGARTESKKIISFWESYFEASGASVSSVEFLEGL